jgi:hypothetical protein
MRKFNEEEREFLKLLVKTTNEEAQFFGYFLQRDFFTKESNTALIIISQKEEAFLFFKKEIFDVLSKRKKELLKFIKILYLTEYLKQERLIDILPNIEARNIPIHFMREDFNNPSNNGNAIKLNNDNVHIESSDFSKILNSKNEVVFEAIKLEKQTYNLIMDNFMGLLFVSEDLIQFVNSDFISEEDRKYRNGQIAVWTSIIIAFIFGLIGIYNPFIKDNTDNIEPISNKLDTIIHNQLDLKKVISKQQKDSIDLKNTEVLATTKNIVHLADSANNKDDSKN